MPGRQRVCTRGSAVLQHCLAQPVKEKPHTPPHTPQAAPPHTHTKKVTQRLISDRRCTLLDSKGDRLRRTPARRRRRQNVHWRRLYPEDPLQRQDRIKDRMKVGIKVTFSSVAISEGGGGGGGDCHLVLAARRCHACAAASSLATPRPCRHASPRAYLGTHASNTSSHKY